MFLLPLLHGHEQLQSKQPHEYNTVDDGHRHTGHRSAAVPLSIGPEYNQAHLFFERGIGSEDPRSCIY